MAEYRKKTLADLIKIQRKKMKLTQERLAERVNLSTQHLSKIENGHYVPSLETFFRLARELQIDMKQVEPNFLISGDEDRAKIISFIITANDTEIKFLTDILEMTILYRNGYKI